jgi:hypothetical protein
MTLIRSYFEQYRAATFSGQPWNRFKPLTLLVFVAFAALSVCDGVASTQLETAQIVGTEMNQTGAAQLSGAQGPSTENNSAAAGNHVTAGLVPAEVALNRTLDARKDQPGAAFEATLKSTVHLKDGTELPKGTLLEGKVATLDAKDAKTSQLSLVFTDAKLKGGKDVPIQATIVGLADPALGTDPNSSYDGPAAWNGNTTQIDITGAINNVDLHSTIGADSSGTLVASGKGYVKLSSGERISLALGERSAN